MSDQYPPPYGSGGPPNAGGQPGYPPPGYPPPPEYVPPSPYSSPQAYPPQGYPPAYPPPGYAPVGVMPTAGTSKWATASLICSLVGLCVGLTSILGIIFGHMALAEINRSNNLIQGRGMAMAGLIIGYAEVALGVIWVIFAIAVNSSGPH